MPSLDSIALLRGWSTPTIANALESLGMSPAADFTDGSLRLLTEGLPPFVGRAATAKMMSASPPNDSSAVVATEAYWRYVATRAAPTVVVVEDVDPSPTGSMWGEVQGRLHRSLGVVGIITNGAARDLDELISIGMPVIGGRTCVSHAFARFVEVDVPVRVGGLEIRPGDLLHADRHGVQRIPAGASLPDIAAVAKRIESLEAEVFRCADSGASIDEFLQVWASVRARWPIATRSRSHDAI
jgi:4-hydroxy-4-methyl-2-oxoglutarate aldolase